MTFKSHIRTVEVLGVFVDDYLVQISGTVVAVIPAASVMDTDIIDPLLSYSRKFH